MRGGEVAQPVESRCACGIIVLLPMGTLLGVMTVIGPHVGRVVVGRIMLVVRKELVRALVLMLRAQHARVDAGTIGQWRRKVKSE